jgi:energy-coupling factor transporter ATP-binding protein EcfA2
VDLMELLRTLHLSGTIVASRHKLERIMEYVCVTVCVFIKR